MDKEKSNKFDELYRLIDVTAKARYRASTRLKRHGMCSQWTLALLAVGLIVVSVIVLAGINVNFDKPYTDVMQIAFSLLILTYSLLLGMGNFDSRSEKLLRCGMELSRILRRVKPYKGKKGKDIDEEYEKLSNAYYDCLEKYENHKDVDYWTSQLAIARRMGYPEKKKEDSWSSFAVEYLEELGRRFQLRFSISVRSIIAFCHYLATLLFVYGWLYLLLV